MTVKPKQVGGQIYRYAVPPEKSTLNTLQAFRGLAAVMVVFFHTTNLLFDSYQIRPLNGMFLFGFAGVDLFFVLSGFIIFLAHFDDIGKPQKLVAYLTKRFIRVYPTYWAILALLSCWYIYSGTDTGTGNGTITFLDSLENIPLVGNKIKLVNPVSWTLYYEILFYLMFSFLILNKVLGSVVLAFWLLGIISTSVFGFHIEFVPDYTFNQYTILFLIGLFSSSLYILVKSKYFDIKNNIGNLSACSGLVIFVITSKYCMDNQIIDGGKWILLASLGISGSLILLGSLSEAIENFFGRQQLLISLGNASYSIYLLHFPLVRETVALIKKQIDTLDAFLINFAFVAICAGAIFCGWFFYLKIEKPLMYRTRKSLAFLTKP